MLVGGVGGVGGVGSVCVGDGGVVGGGGLWLLVVGVVGVVGGVVAVVVAVVVVVVVAGVVGVESGEYVDEDFSWREIGHVGVEIHGSVDEGAGFGWGEIGSCEGLQNSRSRESVEFFKEC